MADQSDKHAGPHATAPVWLNVASYLVFGGLLLTLGQLVGTWAGNRRAGSVSACALWVTLVHFLAVRPPQRRARAAIESLLVGAGIGAVVWFVAR